MLQSLGKRNSRQGLPLSKTELGFKIKGSDHAGEMFPCMEIYG